jgi:hypothetical protein
MTTATPMPYPCPDKSRFQTEWADATNAYAKSVKSLVSQMGKLPKDQYEKLRTEVDAARTLSEKLRQELDIHTTRHGC